MCLILHTIYFLLSFSYILTHISPLYKRSSLKLRIGDQANELMSVKVRMIQPVTRHTANLVCIKAVIQPLNGNHSTLLAEIEKQVHL